jgi:hypothetical protein
VLGRRPHLQQVADNLLSHAIRSGMFSKWFQAHTAEPLSGAEMVTWLAERRAVGAEK